MLRNIISLLILLFSLLTCAFAQEKKEMPHINDPIVPMPMMFQITRNVEATVDSAAKRYNYIQSQFCKNSACGSHTDDKYNEWRGLRTYGINITKKWVSTDTNNGLFYLLFYVETGNGNFSEKATPVRKITADDCWNIGIDVRNTLLNSVGLSSDEDDLDKSANEIIKYWTENIGVKKNDDESIPGSGYIVIEANGAEGSDSFVRCVIPLSKDAQELPPTRYAN